MSERIAPPRSAGAYTQPEPVGDRCPDCGGPGWIGVPIGTPGRPPDGLVRCHCNPAPLVDTAERAKGEMKRRAGRADWWSK